MALSQEREERVQDPVPRVPSMHSRLPTRVGAIVCDLCDLRAHSHAIQGRQWSWSRGGVGLGYDGQRLQKTMDSMGASRFSRREVSVRRFSCTPSLDSSVFRVSPSTLSTSERHTDAMRRTSSSTFVRERPHAATSMGWIGRLECEENVLDLPRFWRVHNEARTADDEKEQHGGRTPLGFSRSDEVLRELWLAIMK